MEGREPLTTNCLKNRGDQQEPDEIRLYAWEGLYTEGNRRYAERTPRWRSEKRCRV